MVYWGGSNIITKRNTEESEREKQYDCENREIRRYKGADFKYSKGKEARNPGGF